ncbi:hypothetical protein WME97_07925 [Sorangium sp. So ce367]|uniref:terpene synthase family protein n=1 Tax=Sorangium sp. So ce367 TaxID=3133305 RepID=UPI003F61305B
MNTPFLCSTNAFDRLHLPWPSRRHSGAERYRRASRDALIGVGLLGGEAKERAMKRFEGIIVLDPYVYPYAIGHRRLLAAGTFSQWLFFLDDQYDDDPRVGRDVCAVRTIMERYLGILRTGDLPARPSPFARFTVHLRECLEALAPEGWMRRFLAHVEQYLFEGSLRATSAWARGQVPLLDDYLHLRMHDSAVFPAIDIIEIAAGLELPHATREHPAVAEMARLTVRHTAYVNDLFSYQKEVLWNDTPCNLVRVMMANKDIGFEEAVHAVVSMVNRDVDRFLEVERAIPSWGPSLDRQVEAYIGGMKAWMVGNVDFSLSSSRYRSEDSPFLELRSAPSLAGGVAVSSG